LFAPRFEAIQNAAALEWFLLGGDGALPGNVSLQAKADGSNQHSVGLSHAPSVQQSGVEEVDIAFKPTAAVGRRSVPLLGSVTKAEASGITLAVRLDIRCGQVG
jgi:hypothetical protein